MTRLRHYVENTGTWGGIKLAILVLVLGFLMVDEVKTGTWIYTLPALGLAIAATYLARNLLVNNVRTVAPILNALVVVAVVAAALFRASQSSGSNWLTILVVAFVGAYLGASFWLLSDPRIVVER